MSDAGKADEQFIYEFLTIIAGLVLFTIVMFFLARIIAAEVFDQIQNSPSSVAQRIAPEAKVRVGDPNKSVAPKKKMAATEVAALPEDGEQVYKLVCGACHNTGLAQAPKLGDKAAWAPRLGAGVEALVASVLKGKGAMPAKGGRPGLTETAVRNAVNYLIGDPGAGAATTTQMVTKAAEQVSETVSSTSTSIATAATSMGASGAAEGKPGDKVYNMSCFACHTTGAANAPKLGDTEAWTTRASQGLDALVQNSLKGKNAMPAKGGNPSLTEADLTNAIKYMLEKANVTPG